MKVSTLRPLLDRLADQALANACVIPWSSPVPAFGDPSRSVVATLGINPSNREFVDEDGRELDGADRRFPTLSSLGLRCWTEAKDVHLEQINVSCSDYFLGNPYDLWFRRLNDIIALAGASYYGDLDLGACHLDLVPYATHAKWGTLSSRQRAALLSSGAGPLAALIQDSSIRVLVLNGSSVVSNFESVCGRLERTEMPGWTLPRGERKGVCGAAFRGRIDAVGGRSLGREVLVLGYNHNIQSSFGVTKAVTGAIAGWVREQVETLDA